MPLHVEVRMPRARRVFALAVLIHLALGAAALAQTVIARNLPPGSTVQFVPNTSVAATASASADGIAILEASPPLPTAESSLDARVWIEACGAVRRVIVADRTVQPPVDAACARTQLEGLFLVQRVTTMVIDLAAAVPSVRIRQGPAPAEWLANADVELPGRAFDPPIGLIVFGGAGYGSFRDFVQIACGSTACANDDAPGVLTAGASYWFSRLVGVEVSFVKPGRLTAEGSGAGFEFSSDTEGGLFALSGTVGYPLGPVRVFGRVGPTYYRGTLTSTQTIDDRTVTIDDEPQTVPGGTQTVQFRTEGWGWVYAAGAEYWMNPWFGLYGEWGTLATKGEDVDGTEGRLDDRMRFILGGVRIRLFGR
jgi:hypothetical protein